MLLVQIYLSHFSPTGLIHLLLVLILFSCTTLRYVSTYMRPLQPSSPLRQQYLSTVQRPDGFATVLPVVLLPLQ